MFITSKNAIVEAINKNIVISIEISDEKNNRNKDIISLATSKNIPIKYGSTNDSKYTTEKKSGIVAYIKDNQKNSLISVLSTALNNKKNPIVFILDGITDIHNYGAVIRNAHFFGIDAIIVPKNNSAPINEKVYEISSGAAYHIPILIETNLVNVVKYLKDNKFWVYYASEKGDSKLESMKFDCPMAVILGNEHSGVRSLLQKHADGSICIASPTGFDSLNVSAASAVIAYAYSTYKL